MKQTKELIKGYSKEGLGRLALGTHLGDFSESDSLKYIEAIKYALLNGIYSIDGAINYRGMCSEQDQGIAIQQLMEQSLINREDFCICSKAGLLFGDIRSGLNPQKYLNEVLTPMGITLNDFAFYDGLYQTLNPAFYEIALNQSLQNLGLETIDIHYIHIPEISKAQLGESQFYQQMARLFSWYEKKVSEGKIKTYGLALEFIASEPNEDKWHFELEKIKEIAEKASSGPCHFKYVIFEYNPSCTYSHTVNSQLVDGCLMSLSDACHKLGLETVCSMPLGMGDELAKRSVPDLLFFALDGMDHVLVCSKNIDHIKEIIGVMSHHP